MNPRHRPIALRLLCACVCMGGGGAVCVCVGGGGGELRSVRIVLSTSFDIFVRW